MLQPVSDLLVNKIRWFSLLIPREKEQIDVLICIYSGDKKNTINCILNRATIVKNLNPKHED